MAIDISVIIPTYRRPELLFRCLAALFKQTFPADRFEVIVVTDGPDPDTKYIMQGSIEGGPVFRLHSLSRRRGPAAARNTGWRMALGELVLFTDDDTIPCENWVASYWEAYETCQENNPYRWLRGERLAFRGPVSVPCPPKPTDYERNTAGLQHAEFVTANCACTSTALAHIGGLDETFTMAWREDSDLHFRLMEESIPIITVPGARVVHPVRPAPWGISLKEQKKSLFNALLYKKHPALFRRRIYAHPFWNYYAMLVCFLIMLVALVFRHPVPAAVAGAVWLIMSLNFAARRLRGASLSLSHITEMVFTSVLIPFLSVYWTLYGAIRYKTFFL